METEVRKAGNDVKESGEGGSAAAASASASAAASSFSSSSHEKYTLPCAATVTGSEQSEEPHNIFRDSPLRYMGYANEIGESFRYQFPRLVVPSYVLSFGYCGMDAATTGYRVWTEESSSAAQSKSSSSSTVSEKLASSSSSSSWGPEKKAATATFDTLLWQSLASVMIPGATINVIVKAARLMAARTPATILPAAVAKWLPTCMGIGSIPVIVHPIDNAVDYALDNTTRAWFRESET